LRGIENSELNIDALRGANVAGSAVNAVDAITWQAERLAQD
jgi:5-oxoprolinase (ATP-hydrolysing) subunit C